MIMMVPKKLKYNKIVSVVEAVKTALTLSSSVFRRNLLDHDSPTKTIPPQLQCCVQRIVQNVRKQVTKQHLDNVNLKDSFGSLHVLCETNLFSGLMRKHNDPENAYHFLLFEFAVLGSQVSPERDIARITLSSVWMILNAFRAIVAGWGFQLNGDVTGKLCRKNIHLVEFGVISTLLSLVLTPFPNATMYSVLPVQ